MKFEVDVDVQVEVEVEVVMAMKLESRVHPSAEVDEDGKTVSVAQSMALACQRGGAQKAAVRCMLWSMMPVGRSLHYSQRRNETVGVGHAGVIDMVRLNRRFWFGRYKKRVYEFCWGRKACLGYQGLRRILGFPVKPVADGTLWTADGSSSSPNRHVQPGGRGAFRIPVFPGAKAEDGYGTRGWQ